MLINTLIQLSSK